MVGGIRELGIGYRVVAAISVYGAVAHMRGTADFTTEERSAVVYFPQGHVEHLPKHPAVAYGSASPRILSALLMLNSTRMQPVMMCMCKFLSFRINSCIICMDFATRCPRC